MRSFNWKTVSTLVTMMAVAGCQESVSAPPGGSAGPVSMMLAPSGSPQLSLGSNAQDEDFDFTVSPAGGTYFFGNNAVVFPSNSICDRSISTYLYGPGTWDTPCVAMTSAQKIHATVRTAKLGTWVDFSPSLRFVPSQDARRWVYLFMYTPNVIGATDISKYPILWTPALGANGVNDAVINPTLKTYVDTKSGISMRRMEHFTGYLTSSGRSCDPAVETDCYPVADK